MSSHTLILIQYARQNQTRTFYDYKSVEAAAEGVTSLFERHLKESNPSVFNISYAIDDLYSFIDQLNDISALVFDPNLKAYVPYNKSWVKGILAKHIQKHYKPSQNRRRN